MKRHCLLLLACALPALLLAGTITAWSQTDLEKALQQLSSDKVKGYMQPVADLFGADMNAGFYHSASIPGAGIHVQIELLGMASMVGDDQKTYTANAPDGFVPPTFTTATVFGGTGATTTDTSGLTYRGSDGVFNTSLFPFGVPQLRVGSLFGTEVVLRYVSSEWFKKSDKFPAAKLFALGARHSISQYLPASPLDLSAGVFYSTLTFGDIVSFKGLSIGAQASKSFAILELYGGVAWEKSTLTLKYSSSNDTFPPVNIDLDGANKFRATVGAGLTLGFFNLFADVNVGTVTNYSGGIGFGL